MIIMQVMVHGYVHDYAGGAPKVFFQLGNGFASRGHEVYSFYNDRKAGKPFFSAESGAKVINLGVEPKGPFHMFWKVLKELTYQLRKTSIRKYFPEPVHREKQRRIAPYLKRAIEEIKPQVVIAYNVQDLNTIRLTECDVPVLLMSHSDVNTIYKGLFFDEFKRIAACDYVQALTPYFAERFSNLLNRKVEFIPNIVPQFSDEDVAKRDCPRRKRIIMVSRLDVKKQQHMLIESFARIHMDFPDWDVVLFGGELTKGYQKHLEDLVAQYDLGDRVFVKGNTNRVYEELIQSDIFAFPSVHEEGFPLALTEAMATGLPCIGIETTAASKFLIADGEAGIVSSNTVEDFTKKLSLIMQDDEYRKALGENARVSMKKYSSDRVCQQWEDLMISAIKSD